MENKAINVSRKDLFAAHNNFIKDKNLKFDEIGMIAYMLYCSKLDTLNGSALILLNLLSKEVK